jgi:hypothetical protein
MHKTELVEAIAKDAGLSRTDAGRAVESFLSNPPTAADRDVLRESPRAATVHRPPGVY